jgi:hypothetical protein
MPLKELVAQTELRNTLPKYWALNGQIFGQADIRKGGIQDGRYLIWAIKKPAKKIHCEPL